MRIQLRRTAAFLPPDVETAEELAPRIGRSVEWILTRPGVAVRHVSHEDIAVMAARAGRAALGPDGPPDLIVNASGVPAQTLPDTSTFISRELGYTGIPCFSVHATCLSFMAALQVVGSLIETGRYKKVLVVSADQGTRGRNFSEPESAALLGDGAAAALITATPEGSSSQLLGFAMSTHPEGAELTEVRGGGVRRHPNDPETLPEHNLFTMHGPGVYRLARRHIGSVLDQLYAEAGLTRADTDLIVPHQASGLALRAVERYGFPKERIVNVVREQGNCVAASIPLALATADAQGRIKRGDTVLLIGTGAGLSIAGALLRW